jgi:hypothetical protein
VSVKPNFEANMPTRKSRVVPGLLAAAAAAVLLPLVWAQSSVIVTFISGPNFCSGSSGYVSYPFCTVPGELPLGTFPVPSPGGSFVDPNFGATVRVLTTSPYIHPYSLPSPSAPTPNTSTSCSATRFAAA